MKDISPDNRSQKDPHNANVWSEEVQASQNCCSRWWKNHSSTEKCYLFSFVTLLIILILIINFLIIISINGEINLYKNHKKDICLTSGCVKVAATILNRIDINADPCDDFYMYSCGNFIKSNAVPDDHYLKNLLHEMQDEVYLEMKTYLESQLLESDGNAIKQIKLLYNSCMNESNANDEKKAMSAFLALFNKIGGEWSLINKEESIQINLEYRLASLFLYQVQPFFQLFITPPERNTSQYAIHLYAGSTVLESAYFTNAGQSLEFQNHINAYIDLQTEVARIFANFKGINESQLDMFAIKNDIIKMVQLEADLANITRDASIDSNYTTLNEDIEESIMGYEENVVNANSTNAQNMFINVNIDQLELKYGSIKWKKLFHSILKVANVETNEILIYSKDYISELVKLIDKYSPETIDNYLCWTIIARYMPYLGPQFRRLFADFRTKVPDLSVETGDSNGSSRLFLSRWKECVHVTSEGLEKPAIVLYLKYKSEILKSISNKINNIIDEIKYAFNIIVDSQNWLTSDIVKDNFKERANSIESKIGVPMFLKNRSEVDKLYEELDIDSEDVLISNIFKMAKHEVMLELKKIDQLADPDTDWVFQPLIANAFYDPSTNNIIMPTGILRFPLISFERPRYLDFATLGIVIGHEISHSVDSNSRKYMTFKNGSSWWTSDVNNIYKEKAKCFAKQYSEYLVESTNEYLNGNHTLEENICDFAGLQQSYTAYKLKSVDNDLQLPGLTDYNSDQLFFIQYAQIWCEVTNEEGNKKSLHDNHSPGRFRANGVLLNSEQFSRAFKCPKNSPMNPTKKCDLWNSNQL